MRTLACIVMLAAGALGFAQSNEDIDGILSTDAMTFGQAAYILLVASENISDDADESRCLSMLIELGWVSADCKVSDRISLGDYSFLVMKAFGIRGGLFYSLFPSARYGLRELLYLGIIQGRADPADALTGDRAIRIINRAIDYKTGVR